MASPSLALPGVVFVGEDDRARLVAQLGPAAGWMIPKGVLGWSHEVSVVARDTLTEQVRRDAKIVMPDEQIPTAKLPLTHQAAVNSPLIAISSKLTQKLVESGIRVHTVGADRVTSSFYYIAEGGGEPPVRVEGDLVAAVGAMLGDRADNAAIERVLDGIVDRLVRSLSTDRVTELSLELAAALPRAAADGTGTQDVDLEAFERELTTLVGASEKYTPFLQEIATKLSETTERRVDIPLYGDARKTSQGPFDLEVGEQKVALLTHDRWLATGPLTEPTAKPAPAPAPAPTPAPTPTPAPAPSPQAKTPEPAKSEPKSAPKPDLKTRPTPAPIPKSEPKPTTPKPTTTSPPVAVSPNIRPLAAPINPPRVTPRPGAVVEARVERPDPRAEPPSTPKPAPIKADPVHVFVGDSAAAESPKTEPIPKVEAPVPAVKPHVGTMLMGASSDVDAARAEVAAAVAAQATQGPAVKPHVGTMLMGAKAEMPPEVAAAQAQVAEAQAAAAVQQAPAAPAPAAKPLMGTMLMNDRPAPIPMPAPAAQVPMPEPQVPKAAPVPSAGPMAYPNAAAPAPTSPDPSRLATTQKVPRKGKGYSWLWILVVIAAAFAGYRLFFARK